MRPTISALTALCAAAAALRVPPPRMMAAAGELLRIRHRVDDVSTTAAFYTQALGFESSDSPGGEKGGVVLRGAGGGLGLELVSAAGAGFQPDAGYQGLSVRVPSVDAALAASTECGGVVLMEPTIVEHGPSMTPDEPESQMNNMTEAVVADPSGFPLLLHECADADAACLSGARLSVFEWKKSQEWCAHALGGRARQRPQLGVNGLAHARAPHVPSQVRVHRLEYAAVQFECASRGVSNHLYGRAAGGPADRSARRAAAGERAGHPDLLQVQLQEDQAASGRQLGEPRAGGCRRGVGRANGPGWIHGPTEQRMSGAAVPAGPLPCTSCAHA